MKPSLVLLTLVCCGAVRAELVFEPTWRLPEYDAVRAKIEEWLDAADVDAQTRRRAAELWPSAAEGATDDRPALLDRIVQTAALVDPRAARLVEACQAPAGPTNRPSTGWLADSDLPPVVRNNLRLYLARWRAHWLLYDETVDALADLSPEEVVDPSALLFYRMAAYHQIVQPDRARAALVQLLEREEEIPARYARVARLVERDLASLDDESLDHVSRRMEDVRRRLSIGRAGKQVQVVEKGVVDSLDKLIEQERQRQQQQQSQSQAGGSSQSSRPLEESRPMELKAPGRVDPKDIGSQSGWGDLPPKQRAEALEQLGRDFPAHYREVIEQYFRDLADQSEQLDR